MRYNSTGVGDRRGVDLVQGEDGSGIGCSVSCALILRRFHKKNVGEGNDEKLLRIKRFLRPHLSNGKIVENTLHKPLVCFGFFPPLLPQTITNKLQVNPPINFLRKV